MRIGVIGVGRMGQTHAATLRSIAEVDSVVLTDVDGDRASRSPPTPARTPWPRPRTCSPPSMRS